MSGDTSVTPRLAAWLALGGSATFVTLLGALHALKPELDPSWRFISEYAIGDHGWLMSLAFLALALAHVALFLAIRRYVFSVAGRIGLTFLLIAAAGLVLAGIFTTDPIHTGQESMTTSGKLHAFGGGLGIFMPFAALLVSWSLTRVDAWAPARRSLRWAAGVAFLGFLFAFASLGVLLSASDGRFGPDVPVGWPNRVEILTYCAWLMLAAHRATRAGGSSEGRG